MTRRFNPWIGCQKIKRGCLHCCAEFETRPRVLRARGIETWGSKGQRVATSDAYWRRPVKWNREAGETGARRRVFCGSMCDVFEDRPELLGWRCELLPLIRRTPMLDWLLLTKRPENAGRLWEQSATDYGDLSLMRWPENVWLGTSASTQDELYEALPHLAQCPAAVHFLSLEPLLEDLQLPLGDEVEEAERRECGEPGYGMGFDGIPIDWVIVGGESGPRARPCCAAWIRSIIRQCKQAGVPCFVKQLGAASAKPGACPSGDPILLPMTRLDGFPLRSPKGADPSEWPEDLRVQDFPSR